MQNTLHEQESEDFIDVETHDTTASEAVNESPSNQTVFSEEEFDEIPDDPNFKPPEVDYDSIGEFCFESDELALKGNTDYKNLLEAIVVLEAQRAKAVKDLEILQKLKDEALSDPFEFVERMRRKEDMNFPRPQKIHPVPVIDWGKYALSGNPSVFEHRQINQQRQMTQEFSRNSNKKAKLNNQNDEPKSAKTDQYWNSEEQRRLKELLIEFPPGEDEAHRWEKIADSLGNHTPIEVATRVRSHYFTLMKDESDRLGKLPNLSSLRKHWGCDVSSVERDKSHSQDKLHKVEEHFIESQIDISDDEEISSDLQDTPEYRELVLLKKALREKVMEETSGLAQHIGYKCCRCKTEPIIGVRWHCVDCKPPLSTDFCEECAGCMYESRQHTADHQLEKQLVSKGFLDRDYMHFLGNDYNYLDPNYMPAT